MEEYPWFKSYDEGVPHTLQPYPARTMVDVVDESARARPYRAFLYFLGSKLLYDDFVRYSDALAAGLVAAGLGRNDRVALLLPNCPQMIIALHGIWKAGAIAVPLNPFYTAHELEQAFNEVRVKVVITLAPFYNTVKDIQPRTGVRTVIATNIKTYLPASRRIFLGPFMQKGEGYHIELQKGDMWFQELIRKHQKSARPAVSLSPTDPAVIFLSGGTTGMTMGATGTHQSLLLSAMQIQAWLRPVLEEWDDRFLLPLPLYHDFNCIGALGTAMINHSSCILVPDPRNMKEIIKNVEKYKPAVIPGVSAFFINMLRYPLVRDRKISLRGIKIAINGDPAVKDDLKSEFESVTGGKLIAGYAMTETMQAATLTPVIREGKEGAAGLPLPDVIMKVVDAETGLTDLSAGCPGEICIKAPNLMLGYWNRPEETAGILRDGWLFTGDIGYIDGDGYVFIQGRKKEMINASGFQVWPREVEEVIDSHPAVAEVAVAGIPDAKQGEAIKAWVVLARGKTATAEEIQDWCRGRLTGYKVPRYIEFRESLPRTMTGKILRKALVEEERAKQRSA